MMDIVGTAWPIIVLFRTMTKGINQGKNIFHAKHHGFSYFFNAIFFSVWGGGSFFSLRTTFSAGKKLPHSPVPQSFFLGDISYEFKQHIKLAVWKLK